MIISFRLIQPICLGGFISYFSQIEGFQVTKSEAYWYASGIVFANVFSLVTVHPFYMYLKKMEGKVRAACSGMIYQKTLRLTKSQANDGENGRVINLLSNDLQKFDSAIELLHNVIKGPFEAILFSIVIYLEIGVAAFVGISFLICFIPLQGSDFNIFNESPNIAYN